MNRRKDVTKIARYREMLKLSLDSINGLVSDSSNVPDNYLKLPQLQSDGPIQEYLDQLVNKMEVKRQLCVKEKGHLEQQGSQTTIHGIQEEHRMAPMASDGNPTLSAPLLEVERTHEEHEQEVSLQSMGGTPSLQPQTYLSPTFSGPIPPIIPHMYQPYPYFAQLLSPLQLFYPHPQAQRGISLQINYHINSGNTSSVSMSNVNNDNRCVYPSPFLIFSILLYLHT